MGSFLQPLGLLYIADALEKRGERVILFHETGSDRNIRFLIALAKSETTKWIGFSVTTGPGLIPTIKASKKIKRETDCKIIWGGMHPTVVDDVESLWYVDKAVKGDGEAWVTGKPIVNLDDYQPAWHRLYLDKYNEFMMVTSRGCKYSCTFCYNSGPARRKWIAHSVDKTLEIIESYPKKIDYVQFRDDYFFTDVKRAIKITDKLTIPWWSTIRADHLTPERVKSLKNPPHTFLIGIESRSQRLLNLINKGINIKNIINAVETALRYDIQIISSLIVDLPTETPKEREATVKFARFLEDAYPNVQCKVKSYRPYPGTKLFDLAIKEGMNVPRTTQEWREHYELII